MSVLLSGNCFSYKKHETATEKHHFSTSSVNENMPMSYIVVLKLRTLNLVAVCMSKREVLTVIMCQRLRVYRRAKFSS